jgi:hypothetical protein
VSEITGKTFCATFDLEGMLRRGPDALDGILIEDEVRLSGQQVYDLMWQKWLEGFVVLPVCDNHGPDGHCLGHPFVADA